MPVSHLKIKAFTLSEMLVVLLITTLVVGLSFGVLQLVQKQMHGMSGHYETHTQINRLKQSLWIDFNSSDRAYFNPQTSQLYFNDPIRAKGYYFMQDRVIGIRDTFFLGDFSYEFFFENQAPVNVEVDALSIEIMNEGATQKIFVYKRNAASSFLNQ